jgi:RNA polymerase sigma factor FliA
MTQPTRTQNPQPVNAPAVNVPAVNVPAVNVPVVDVDELVTAHLPLVGHVVREMLARVPAHVRREDLFSAGSEALVAAARGYDPSRGTPFGAFASLRIRGALLDELRSLDWASRSVRGKVRRIEAERDRFVAEHGRVPTPTELATRLDTNTRDITNTHDDAARATLMSLQAAFPDGTDHTAAGTDALTHHDPSPEQTLLDRERIGYLRDAITNLPDRLRTVIEAYYYNQRPMAELATELGVTESRISQLRAEATTLLRNALTHALTPENTTTTTSTTTGKPDGCAARRRTAYYTAVATHGTLHTRLAHTTTTGLPLNPIAA